MEAAYLAREATVCRLPMVYGERDHQRREEPILRRVRAGRTRIPAGSGGWLWTRGYVRDVAAGIRLALESDACVAEVLNLGEARTWSMGLWARHVLEAAGSDAELARVPDVLLPDDLKALGTIPQHLLVDSSKARDLLGWTETDPPRGAGPLGRLAPGQPAARARTPTSAPTTAPWRQPAEMTSRPGRDQGRPRVVLAPEIAEIAGAITNRMPDLVDRVVRRILTEIEFYRDRGVISLEDIRGSVRDNLESMAAELITSQPPDLSAPRATGRRRAEQGTPLADILHAYRIGFTEFWEAIVEEGRRSTRATPDTLVDAASGVWWLIGEYTQELTVAYREAASELLLAAARERSALVEAVFTGGIPDRDTLWEAAKLLRLPWEGVFVVVVVEAPGLAQEGLPDAEAFLAGRGIGSAWHLHPDIQMGVVSLRHADALPVLLELLRRGVRARCGVSPAYPALGDTPRAVHYARLVLASLPAGAPAVVQFEETPLGVLAAAAPDAAGALVRTVLGPVLDLPDQERSSLLGTLRAWFDAGGSAAETGKRIYVHPNTVRYRLRRLQEHTGRSLDDPKAVAELLAALDALRLLQEPGPPGPPLSPGTTVQG